MVDEGNEDFSVNAMRWVPSSFRRWRLGQWLFVAAATLCCFTPCQLRAESAFAGTKAGEERGRFCWCPPGKFKMGSPWTEANRQDNEGQVDVTLSRGFWMGKYEVNQAQYQYVMGKNPSRFKGVFLPVDSVEWNEAVEFCEKLTKVEQEAERLPKGWEYRLPTEAQWEYACRAGTTTAYSFGDDWRQLGDHAWYDGNSGRRTHVVGRKKPNAWGLCDMYGNVWEWCRDMYEGEQLPGGSDPEVTKRAWDRAVRGAGWSTGYWFCRSAYRAGSVPDDRGDRHGFRVAMVQSGAEGASTEAVAKEASQPKQPDTHSETEAARNSITLPSRPTGKYAFLSRVGSDSGEFRRTSPFTWIEAEWTSGGKPKVYHRMRLYRDRNASYVTAELVMGNQKDRVYREGKFRVREYAKICLLLEQFNVGTAKCDLDRTVEVDPDDPFPQNLSALRVHVATSNRIHTYRNDDDDVGDYRYWLLQTVIKQQASEDIWWKVPPPRDATEPSVEPNGQ